jgi:hypothetical protein
MTERDRYSVHFRISGPDLDVDALVAVARPNGTHEIWRRGELVGDEGQVARTSGLQIELADAAEETDVLDAMHAFLDVEASFIAALARAVTDDTHAVIACALWVVGDEPVSLTLPPALHERLAAAGLSLEVTGYPIEGA